MWLRGQDQTWWAKTARKGFQEWMSFPRCLSKPSHWPGVTNNITDFFRCRVRGGQCWFFSWVLLIPECWAKRHRPPFSLSNSQTVFALPSEKQSSWWIMYVERLCIISHSGCNLLISLYLIFRVVANHENKIPYLKFSQWIIKTKDKPSRLAISKIY